jgi:hypothetical protein
VKRLEQWVQRNDLAAIGIGLAAWWSALVFGAAAALGLL